MKLKIRESFEKISYFDEVDQNFNYLKIKIIKNIKYIILNLNDISLFDFFVSEIPLIQNYSKYTIYSNNTINYSLGCSTKFHAPNYVFPSWDKEISNYSGITFGKIQVKDFFVLTNKQAFKSSPNSTLAC